MVVFGKEVEGLKKINNIAEADGEVLGLVVTDETDIKSVYIGLCRSKASRIILVDCTESIDISCLLTLLVNKGTYDIYSAEEDMVDDEYMEMVEDRECTEEEAMTFIKEKLERAMEAEKSLSDLAIMLKDGKYGDVEGFVKQFKEGIFLAIENTSVYKGAFEIMAKELEDVCGSVVDKSVSTENSDVLKKEIEESKQVIEELRKEIDSLKVTVDEKDAQVAEKDREIETVNKVVAELKGSEEELKVKVQELENQVPEQNSNEDKEREELENMCEMFKHELARVTEENKKLIRDINGKGPVISVVDPVITSAIRCKTSRILYIKELSYVPYVNTLMCVLRRTIDKLLRNQKEDKTKIRCKLVICDDKVDFPLAYEGVLSVKGDDYLSKKDKVIGLDDKSADTIVIKDNTNAILGDILKQELGVVIVYDRLKVNNDLVKGSIVEKYWVINSKKGIDKAREIMDEIESDRIITRPDVEEDTIGLAEIANYRKDTHSSRTRSWLFLGNCNDRDKESPEKVIHKILRSIGINIKR